MRLNDASLDQLFRTARTHRAFLPREVEDETLRELWSLVSLAPTALNSVPLRVVFVRSPEAKERLLGCVDAGNVDKTKSAPVTAILAFDLAFHEKLPMLAPGRDLASMFQGPDKADAARETAMFNAQLQAGLFFAAARALGLDVGPMGGFDKRQVDERFLSGSDWRSFLLVNLGYGDPSVLRPRAPRLAFETSARIA